MVQADIDKKAQSSLVGSRFCGANSTQAKATVAVP